MKKLINIVIVVLAAGMATLYAMPTPAALEKARPLIQELMADDFAALKADKKTHEAVGDAAMKLLSNAETEAAKFLLCKAAFGLYIRGKAYDKAADVLETFRESISDLPTSDLVELVQKNAKGVRGKDAPKLFAAYRALQAKATAEKERDKARTALADNPSDATLRRAYAEWCVHAGDWKTALASFAKLEGDFAKAVQNESSDRATAADFWWNYEPTVKSTALKEADIAFKRHAVTLYKHCKVDGSLSGLRMNLAEKRIAQLEISVESISNSGRTSQPKKSIPVSYVAQHIGVKIIGDSVTLKDGVLTGFTDKSYAIIDVPFSPRGKSFEICFELIGGEKMPEFQGIVTKLGTKFGISPLTYTRGRLCSCVSSTGKEFNVCEDFPLNTTLLPLKPVRYMCSWNRKEYAWYKQVGNDWSLLAKIPSSEPVHDGLKFCLGNTRGVRYPFGGAINLNYSYIKIDGRVWWEGSRGAARK